VPLFQKCLQLFFRALFGARPALRKRPAADKRVMSRIATPIRGGGAGGARNRGHGQDEQDWDFLETLKTEETRPPKRGTSSYEHWGNETSRLHLSALCRSKNWQKNDKKLMEWFWSVKINKKNLKSGSPRIGVSIHSYQPPHDDGRRMVAHKNLSHKRTTPRIVHKMPRGD